MAAVGGNSRATRPGGRGSGCRAVGLVTRRGEDFPAEHLARLRPLGVDLAGVVDIPGPTVRNWVIYEEDGRRTWLYRTPVVALPEVAPQPEDLPASWLPARIRRSCTWPPCRWRPRRRIVERVRRRGAGRAPHPGHPRGLGRRPGRRVLALAARVTRSCPAWRSCSRAHRRAGPRGGLDRLAGLPTPVLVVKAGPEGSLVWDRGTGERRRVGPPPGPVRGRDRRRRRVLRRVRRRAGPGPAGSGVGPAGSGSRASPSPTSPRCISPRSRRRRRRGRLASKPPPVATLERPPDRPVEDGAPGSPGDRGHAPGDRHDPRR